MWGGGGGGGEGGGEGGGSCAPVEEPVTLVRLLPLRDTKLPAPLPLKLPQLLPTGR